LSRGAIGSLSSRTAANVASFGSAQPELRSATASAAAPVVGATDSAGAIGTTGAIGTVVRWVAAFFGFPGVSALPGQPTLAGLALAVRRQFDKLFFNQAPTAAPVTLVKTGGGQIVGTLGATDAEGDFITYTVTQTPQYGTVRIDDYGFYTYTPGSEFAGTDSFAVTLDDPGFHINLAKLSGDRGTPVTVNITTPVANFDRPSQYTLTNLTSHPLKVTEILLGRLAGITGVDLGTIVYPTEDLTFETDGIDVRVTTGEYREVTLQLRSVDENGELDSQAAYRFRTTDDGTQIASCGSDTGGECEQSDHGYYVHYATLKDAKDTVITMPASEAKKQTELIEKACAEGANANFKCSFKTTSTPVTQYTDDSGHVRYLLGEEIPVGHAYTNDSATQVSRRVTIEATYRSGVSLDLTSSASLNLFDMVKADLSSRYSLNVEATYDVTFTDDITIDKYTEVLYSSSPAIVRATGDVMVKMGNTTWDLQDVVVDMNNPRGGGEFYRHDVAIQKPSSLP
jgi:hypothetical protein